MVSAVTCFRLFIWSMVFFTGFAASPFKLLSDLLPKLNAQIEKFEPCPEYPQTPIQFQDLVISQAGFNKYLLTGHINITETLDRPIHLEIEMSRCGSKDDSDSCEYYFTWRQKGVCDLLDRNDKSWDFYTKGTDLPSTCPFPVKTYTMYRSTIDVKALQSIPFFQTHWRLKNKLYQKDKLMFCLITEFTLQMVRRQT